MRYIKSRTSPVLLVMTLFIGAIAVATLSGSALAAGLTHPAAALQGFDVVLASAALGAILVSRHTR